MIKIDPDTIETALILLGVAFLASIGKTLASSEPRTAKQAIGYAISNSILGLVSGAACLFVADPNALVLIAISAALGTLGTETASVLIRQYLESKIS
ncbi:MAG: hypothetical protein COA90_00925 [Gammaproteobacteria bacterium]|nr:MAG: hypothetical protein COA90_00925 [Gammaproteobacteria bacterium]